MPRKKSASADRKGTPSRRSMPAVTAMAKKVSSWNFRVEPRTEALIDAAAAAIGRSRTDFVLQSARAHAEEVLLNRLYFSLRDADWQALQSALDAPAPANGALKAAFQATPLWNKT